MAEAQSGSGRSAADSYDTRGSKVDLTRLNDTDGISFVEELGRRVSNERAGASIRRLPALAQVASATFNLVITDLPQALFHVSHVVVMTDQPTRIAHVTVSALLEESGDTEIPLFTHQAARGDDFRVARVLGDPDLSPLLNILVPVDGFQQQPRLLMAGRVQPVRLRGLALRGICTAFGAGTVDIVALATLSFSQADSLGSWGISPPPP